MKRLDEIPQTKLARVSKFMKMGSQVGMNYAKYYGKRLFQDEEEAREQLHEANAKDLYDGLSELKGSALKMLQMMSMDQHLLPEAYVEQFSLAQFSVPPLSAPLVRLTIKKNLGKYPEEIFDHFEAESSFAASIGQVHRAQKGELQFAVKVQYPGVAASIESDLKLVKPIAMRMFHIKKGDADHIFREVEAKLLEETDYNIEREQGTKAALDASVVPNVRFPKYFPEYSCEKVLTMEWMEGQHLSEFYKQNEDKSKAHALSQTLWDFFLYQLFFLKKVHADPHPGNFLVNAQQELVALDFGCMKAIPEDFHRPYIALLTPGSLDNEAYFCSLLQDLGVYLPGDTDKEKKFITKLFHELLSVLTLPFQGASFDFGNDGYFEQLGNIATALTQNKELQEMNGARGSEHFIYINRTLLGLYNLIHNLDGGAIDVLHYQRYLPGRMA